MFLIYFPRQSLKFFPLHLPCRQDLEYADCSSADGYKQPPNLNKK